MLRLSFAALLAVNALAVALPLSAQESGVEAEAETGTGDTAPEATAGSDTTLEDAAGGLSMGTSDSDDAGSAVGSTYTVETFTDWQLNCVRAADGDDPCQLYQLLRDGDGNSVAEITMFPLPAGGQAAAGSTVITPLETLLTAQLRLRVDNGEARRYPYAFCSTIGCFARLGFTDAEVAQFRAGNQATVTIVPAAAPDQTVDLTVSLAGFTAGFRALQERLAAE